MCFVLIALDLKFNLDLYNIKVVMLVATKGNQYIIYNVKVATKGNQYIIYNIKVVMLVATKGNY